MGKIDSRVATFVGADGNRMIERFEHVVSVRSKWLFDQLDSKFFQRRDRVSIMTRRPRFIGVDEQTYIWRGSADSFDTRKIAIVATKFQFENWQVDSSRGGIGHPRWRIKTDCERCLDLIGNRNVRQLPGAFAGALPFQVPQGAIQRISRRA